jgi:hypothetical protein
VSVISAPTVATPDLDFRSSGRKIGSGCVVRPAPEHADYGSFAVFGDPEGNGWLLQEIKTRLPDR